MADLNGKVALVTGASKEGGIGRAIALRLARDGADVIVADLCSDKSEKDAVWKGLQDRVREFEALGRRGLACHVDITDDKVVDALIGEIKENFDRLDIVCNNAGAAFGMNLSYMISPTDWRKMIDINLTGTFLVSRAAAQWMTRLNNGGSIINTASWRGWHPHIFMAAYNASKAAVISLTQTMALELAAQKIRVNAICPGKVDTDMERAAWELKANAFGKSLDDLIKEETDKIPLKVIAKPDDIANLVSFLASEESFHMTGQAVQITGGMDIVRV
jgi:NAD(P)-dependent dehydrogenase (short-subunit alcohol dehydrogenase family)